MGIIKDKNYISVQGWMVNQLRLKGNDLLIYAIIYGFTQDGEQWFEGGRQYLASWCNSTKAGVQQNLKRLVEKGLILKKESFINNVKFCKYQVNFDYTSNDGKNVGKNTPSKQSLLPPSKQSLPNNIEVDNININNIDNNIYDHSEKIRNDRQYENAQNEMFEDKIKHDEADNGITVSTGDNQEQKNLLTAKQLEEEFNSLWDMYPRKQGKKAAKAAFDRAIKKGTSTDNIRAGIEQYVDYIKTKKISQEYIKQGSTFFSQNAWEDDWGINNAESKKEEKPLDFKTYVEKILSGEIH